MTLQSLNRWKAFGLHFAVSVVLALAVVILVLVLWYPRPYFAAMGGETLLRLLIGVDVVLGPLITLIIFDAAKPRLKYDLAAIGVLQVAALVYGGYVMFEARPVYNVFSVDRFDIAAANTIDAPSLAKAADEFHALPVTGPRVVGARMPADAKAKMDLTLESALGGADLYVRPNLYVPYAEVAADAARVAKPLSRLARGGPDAAQQVRTFIDHSGRSEASVGYVPVRARNRDMAAIVDRNTGEVVGFLPIDPW